MLRLSLIVPLLVSVAMLAAAAPASAAASMELYGNFHAAGIIVTIDAADDPDWSLTATVRYRTGSAAFADGFPLTRTRDTQLAGSLFWLEPGTSYDVQVSLSDPGGPLDGQVLAGAVTTRAEITIPAASASYYVSATGIGTACSLAAPCSLSEGLSQASAGEEVVLRGGTYRLGGLWMPRSGSPGAPIVIRAYPGETPILDGSDPQDFVWTDMGGGVWRTTVNVGDPHLVVAAGERLYPYATYSDLANLVWGFPGFYASGTTVWVRLAGNANPNPVAMRVSRHNLAFEVSQDHIYFVGLTFRYYGQGSWAKAIYFNNASHNLVRGCTFEVCDLGIGIKRVSHRNVIESNEFFDTIFQWPWDAVKNGSALETGGVRLYNPTSGRGNVIRNNIFHDDFDGFGVCPAADTGTTIEVDVYGNEGYNLGDDGVETDGHCSNLRLWDNTFHDVLVGISLAPVYVGPVYAVRNLIYATGEGNSAYSGTCFKLNSGYPTSGRMYLMHNTCDAVNPGNTAFAIKSPGTWTGMWARNNIFSGTDYALSNANPSQPVDLDYDNLVTTRTGELVWWQGLADTHLNTLAELRSATGHEMHGRSQAPAFASASTGDYGLASDSPLIDVGLLIPGMNDDFEGSAPDLGAFEWEVGIFADGFESANLTAWSRSTP